MEWSDFLSIAVAAALLPFVWRPWHKDRDYFRSRGLPTDWSPGAIIREKPRH